jgi:putative resolvase
MKQEVMNIQKACKYLGVALKTMQRWDREGKFKAERTATNRRYYTINQLDKFLQRDTSCKSDRMNVAYCRVSSRNQLPDLKNQRSVIEEFCIAKGLGNVEYIEEVGGGLNFKRKEFLRLIDMIVTGRIGVLVIAHKDRFVRFGFELIEHLCTSYDVDLQVINSEKFSPELEISQDLLEIVDSFSYRIDGLNQYRKTLQEALKK